LARRKTSGCIPAKAGTIDAGPSRISRRSRVNETATSRVSPSSRYALQPFELDLVVSGEFAISPLEIDAVERLLGSDLTDLLNPMPPKELPR
jgi:hypothetical protein